MPHCAWCVPSAWIDHHAFLPEPHLFLCRTAELQLFAWLIDKPDNAPSSTREVKTMKRLGLCLMALLGAGSISAETLDCAALANSALAEPEGYAAQCGAPAPSPSVAVSNLAPTDTGFALDIRGQSPRLPNSLYSFTLNAFNTQTLRGVSSQASIFAMDFNEAGTTLYAITGSTAMTNPSTLGTLNSTTGAFTAIAPLTGLTAGDSASGLAIHPRTGLAYFSAVGGSPSTARLYTLNLATGALTLVGQITAPTDGTGTLMIDIAINCEGQLFAHNIADDALYSVSTTTGAGTLIGTHGLAANFAQGMDFDNQDGTLYAYIYTGTGTNRFGTFNLATGAFTTLVQDNPLGEYEGAIPTQCPSLGSPTATLTASSLNFGSLMVGSTGTSTQTLTNTGNAPLDVTAITAATAPFSRTGGTCAGDVFTLAPSASCTLIYTFAPTAAVTSSQVITVSSNGGNPTFTLQGEGVAPADTVTATVPSTSLLSLLALLAGLAGIALFALRRR